MGVRIGGVQWSQSWPKSESSRTKSTRKQMSQLREHILLSSTFLFHSGPRWIGWRMTTLVREMNANSSSMMISHFGRVFVSCRKLHFLIQFITLTIRKQCLSDLWNISFPSGSCAPRCPPRHTHLVDTCPTPRGGAVIAPGIFRKGQRRQGSFRWLLTFNSGSEMLQIKLRC